jgi:hypothetical protein
MKIIRDIFIVFIMTVCLVPFAQAVEMGKILSAETRTGSITDEGQTDSWTFSGDAGQTTVIILSEITPALVPEILLFDPDGIIEISEWDYTSVEIMDHKLLKSGTYTILVKDHPGIYTGDYSLSFSKIPAPQNSPSIRTILNQDVFTTGETLVVAAYVVNGPDPVRVEVKMWVKLPDDSNMSILDPHFTFTVEPNADFTTEIFTHTFSGGEPSGDYNVGGRFLNPISGRELSVNVESFSFSP